MQCDNVVYCRIGENFKSHCLLVVLHRDEYFHAKENRSHYHEQAIAIAIVLNHVEQILKPFALTENATEMLCSRQIAGLLCKIRFVAVTRHAEFQKPTFRIAITFCLASVQKLLWLLFYIKNTVVKKTSCIPCCASKHHALT